MSNAYTLISQSFPNTYIEFGDGDTTGNPSMENQQLTENNVPKRILYSQNNTSGLKLPVLYQNISGTTQSYQFNWQNITTGQSSKYFYAISSEPATAGTNFSSTTNYSNANNLDTTSMGTVQTSWTIVSQAMLTLTNIPKDYYVSIIGSANQQAIDNLGALPSVDGTCFTNTAMVLMGDLTWKKISEIKRGDIVISDFETKKTQTVSRVLINSGVLMDAVVIPKDLIGNSVELVCTYHPVFVKNGTERRYTGDIIGTTRTKTFESFYNLQFDEEGTYYIEGIKVDSVSPYFHTCKLPEEYFINPANNKNLTMYTENEEHRNKPIHKNEPIEPEFVDLIDLSSLDNKPY